MPQSLSPRGALFFGLTIGSAGLTTGCDAPQTGSLENVKKKPQPKPENVSLDYKKLDYSKIDYSKIDYSKIDYSKVDASKVDLSKLDDKTKAKIAAKNLKSVGSATMADLMVKRLNKSRAKAVKAKDNKQIKQIDDLIKRFDVAKKTELFSDVVARW